MILQCLYFLFGGYVFIDGSKGRFGVARPVTRAFSSIMLCSSFLSVHECSNVAVGPISNLFTSVWLVLHSPCVVTIISTVLIVWLVISEFAYYLEPDVRPELKVDTTRGQKMKISFDITFHHVPCAYMGVDAMDASGEHQLSVDHNIFKIRLGADGRQIATEKQELNAKPVKIGESTQVATAGACGDCYGSEDDSRRCCNTCEEVREQYSKKGWALDPDTVMQCKAEGFTQKLKDQAKEGCRIHGFIHVNKVQGNFHFAPGKSFQTEHMHVHDLAALSFQQQFDLSHKITRLSFGEPYPGIINPLDEVEKTWKLSGSAMYQYFIKIVPTTYREPSGALINSNQFSVNEHERILTPASRGGLPGVFFIYDFSPIMVSFTEHTTSFAHFLTSLCAIVGGVFTVAGIIDSFIYHLMKSLNQQRGALGTQ